MLADLFWHASLAHLIGNLVLLVIFGPAVFHALGFARFAVVLIAAQAGGLAAQSFSDWLITDPRPVLGASAIGYGLIAAYGILYPRAYPVLITSANGAAILWVVFICSVILAFVSARSSVAHAAHVGGMIAAALLLKSMEVPRKNT